MKRLTAACIAFSMALAATAGDAPLPQWVCVDAGGRQVVQPQPCDRINTQFRADDVPVYVWGIVALLGLAWVLVLVPERLLPRRRLAAPGFDLAEPDPLPAPPAPGPRAPAQPQITRDPRAPAARAPRAPGWSLETLAGLPPRRFDELVQALWQANGYKAVLTGDDVKIHSAASGNLFAVAQRAAVPGAAVPAATVQGLWDHVQRNGIALGICYGVAGFASDALMFAQGKRLKLVSGTELLAQLRGLKAEQQRALLEHVCR